jgi:MYXO-CTERM domain-containing protein
VLWDYESSDSNYTALRKLAYDATGGRGWLVEASMPYSASNFRSQVAQVVDFQGPGASGYTDDPNDYEGAHAALNEDMDVLFAGMKETSVSVTRFRAELSRPALAQDLFMGASDDQSPVSNVIQTTKWTGTQPACPPPPDCDDVDVYYPNGTPASDGDPRTVSSCAMSHERDAYGAATFGGLAILVMLGFRVRRRRR